MSGVMNQIRRDHFLLAAVSSVMLCLLVSCETGPKHTTTSMWASQHQEFRAKPGWKRQVFVNPPVMEQLNVGNCKVKVSLADQRGFLLLNGEHIAMDFPVATGTRDFRTPTGMYSILDKKVDHASNLYGKFVDKETGSVVKRDASVREDELPEGAKFVGASMPNWMRLTNSGIGMHIGYVPGYPASHGCIRVVRPAMERLFPVCKRGTEVVVYQSWTPDPMAARPN